MISISVYTISVSLCFVIFVVVIRIFVAIRHSQPYSAARFAGEPGKGVAKSAPVAGLRCAIGAVDAPSTLLLAVSDDRSYFVRLMPMLCDSRRFVKF